MSKEKGKKSSSSSSSSKREEVNSLEYLRGHVILGENNLSGVSSTEYPGVYADADDAFSLESFKKNFQLKEIHREEGQLEFDMIGLDASIANAIRRVIIAEVPTMAIEKVFIMNNTSIIHDEILAHRLGLIPIYADPSQFEMKDEDEDPTDLNTIVFTLNLKCERNPEAPADAADPKVKYINSSVYSGDLQWQPEGDQAERFKDDVIRPFQDKILIAKLRPGQEIDLQVHCEKGVGKTHAKWSPVAVSSYRLMPEITLLEDITGDLADKLATCFAPGVIGVEENEKGVRVARVANARNDATNREVQRHEDLVNKVHLAKKRDHFIFSIESVGFIQPPALLKSSLKLLIEKTKIIKSSLAKLIDPDFSDPEEEGNEEEPSGSAKAAQKEGGEEEEEEGEEEVEGVDYDKELAHQKGSDGEDDD